jgi:protocatechuate 3,4-dioxygenase beta subunit
MNKYKLMLTGIMVVSAIANPAMAEDLSCAPTPEDSLGPFYKPNAPTRSTVGEGYVLSGVVKSARDCSIVPGAKIEFWLAAANGSYDDDHRAIVLADGAGLYKFQSNVPPKYNFRPPHIHVRVTAEGFYNLVAQHYPKVGSSAGEFPLVLVPR